MKCKYCGGLMRSQGVDVMTATKELECFICEKCGAAYDRYMDLQGRTLDESWLPSNELQGEEGRA